MGQKHGVDLKVKNVYLVFLIIYIFYIYCYHRSSRPPTGFLLFFLILVGIFCYGDQGFFFIKAEFYTKKHEKNFSSSFLVTRFACSRPLFSHQSSSIKLILKERCYFREQSMLNTLFCRQLEHLPKIGFKYWSNESISMNLV